MANWRYTLKFSKALRNAIDEEDYSAVVDALVACFTELSQLVPGIYDDSELQEDLMELSDIQDEIDDCDDYCMDSEELEDTINGMLSKLYDICDSCRIWIAI